jgi:hypothetical protein
MTRRGVDVRWTSRPSGGGAGSITHGASSAVAVTAKGHFLPTELAALKTLCLVTRRMDPKGTGQAR